MQQIEDSKNAQKELRNTNYSTLFVCLFVVQWHINLLGLSNARYSNTEARRKHTGEQKEIFLPQPIKIKTKITLR